ncbi:hypothetical protein Q4534_14935 [Cyclobacterium sp. 1_MG-2023]|uniref:hypothetical protein n=1 Tax=Cyclobacterium sp. 1_MG-2023 TaxID=3062681 RepID=UPI0026E3824D|nr:hypothetical protein [Cyclobacterium sp. 1_MG-2023]MDO6438716.1 hypothetical protein [Cyclobacterium sp. 1_MG-2023]
MQLDFLSLLRKVFKSPKEKTAHRNFSITIRDSINIDHLDPLHLKGYDPKPCHYALTNAGIGIRQILRLNDKGAEIEMEKRDTYYAVLLDKDYNVLDSNVKFPLGVHYPNVVNRDNKVVALKNPDLFDVEENHVTLYKMELGFE